MSAVPPEDAAARHEHEDDGDDEEHRFDANDNDAPPEDRIPAEEWDTKSNQAWRPLFAMMIGLKKEDGTFYYDPETIFEQPPFNGMKATSVKVQASDMIKEIKRRSEVYSSAPAPKCSKWKNSALLEWLVNHPIEADRDVAFLQQAYETRVQMQLEARSAEEQENAAINRQWRGVETLLRLIHAILDESNRHLFLHRNDVEEQRINIDAGRPQRTIWDAATELYNDPRYIATTIAMPNLCSEFPTSRTITYADVADYAVCTPQIAKQKFEDMVLRLKRVIQHWEHSGQGDGGDFERDYDGQLQDRPSLALGTRSNFFLPYPKASAPQYLLYLWEMLESLDLWRDSLQKIDGEIAANIRDQGICRFPGQSGGCEVGQAFLFSTQFVSAVAL